MTLIAAVLLITLHAPGGIEIDVAPEQVTNLRYPPKVRGGTFPADANCVVSLTDGKNVPVMETCDEVRLRLENR